MKECFLQHAPERSANRMAYFDGVQVYVNHVNGAPVSLGDPDNMRALGNFLLECVKDKEEYLREKARKEVEKSRPVATFNTDGSLRVGVYKTDHWYTKVRIGGGAKTKDAELITAMVRWCDAMNSIGVKDTEDEEGS